MRPFTNTAEKFWSLAEVLPWSGCWIWMGGVGDTGYGQFSFNGKQHRTHRLAFELATGTSPKGKVVCHKCDVRLCVNPSHLFLGEHADNARDMWRKGRAKPMQKRGSDHGMALLTEKQVLEIRAKYAGRFGQLTALGKEYGVTVSTIFLIVKRRNWAHI